MRDIPFFTTEFGVASLTLKEIPYRGIAYVRIQDSRDPVEFLKECVSFCRGAGATRVFASGHSCLEAYPLHTKILQMSCPKESLPDTDAALFPVQADTIELWRITYNERMKNVDNSAYLSIADARQLLQKADGYFVHREGKLLGIGIVNADKIDAVASCVSGCGKDVLLALCHAVFSDVVLLEVASTNERAIRLYRSLGFVATAELSSWYEII